MPVGATETPPSFYMEGFLLVCGAILRGPRPVSAGSHSRETAMSPQTADSAASRAQPPRLRHPVTQPLLTPVHTKGYSLSLW